MDVTELAHWRYRVKALPGEIGAARRHRENLHSFYRYSDGAEMVAAIKKAKDSLALAEYLFEEAKYMVELGELTVT